MANANFTPDIGPYTELKPFRFWCQKVLPLVYDDSLSYYELLGKVVDYLNKTMEDVDTQITDIQGLLSAYEALQGWVNAYYTSADFAAAIDDGLDRMAESGQLTALINAIIAPQLPDIVDLLLPEAVMTLLPDEVSSQIPGTVATQLPSVVSNQIPGTVANQLPAVVSNQIPGTVANQLPAVVSNQIGPVVEDKIVDPVEDWLDANVSGGIAVDRTLSVLGAGADAAFTGARLETLDNVAGYEHIADTGFIITTANPYAFNYEIINDNDIFSDQGTHTYKMIAVPVNTGDKYCINAHKISVNETENHFAVTYAFCAKWIGDPETDIPYYRPTTYSRNNAENLIVTVPEITIPSGQGYDTTGYLVVITADIEDPVYKVVDEGLRKDLNVLKSDLSQLSDAVSITTLLTLSDTINTGKYLSANQNSYGQLVDGSSPSHWEYTDYVDVSGYSKVAITASCYTNRLYYCFYDANKDPIANSGKAYNGDLLEDYIVDVPNGAKYCIAAFYFSTVTYDPIIKGVELKPDLTGAVLYSKSLELTDTQKSTARDNIDAISKTVGKNKFNPATSVGGYISNNTGSVLPSETYETTDFIDISAFTGSVCVSGWVRDALQYDEDKAAITSTYISTASNPIIAINENAHYIRISYYVSRTDELQIEDGTEQTGYEPYTLYVEPDINCLNEKTKQAVIDLMGAKARNVLYGKKWIHFGDSFSAYTNKQFTSGSYIGKDMSYPRLIAERNNMVINEDFFKSGRTLAYPSDGTFTNSATCPTDTGYYQNIPADADYITIMLGINDLNHQSGSGTSEDGEDQTGVITLGTINDNGTDTYYGAWNNVLGWIRQNRPFAHVGIIITNGTQSQGFTEAQILEAKKWGFPYINLNGDERTPAFIRCYNPDLPSALKESLKTIQGVDAPTNTHPNWQTHELESTIIENWLRTL